VSRSKPILVIGAGPAGLTAAYRLVQEGEQVVVLEADSTVGGISRTVQVDGWRFDIGGHRFFTKVPEVESLWHEILPDDDFLMRPRMSRIYYNGKFFDYPLRAFNALAALGPLEALRCVGSYLWVRIHPPSNQDSFEGWTAARFGWRLYRKFFKSYTEKVWGMPATSIKADWAAQRIKNLSLGKAIFRAMFKYSGSETITSLIEEFQYPKYGPGMMWERCRDLVSDGGGTVLLNSPVVSVRHRDGSAHSVVYSSAGAGDTVAIREVDVSAVISSMPLKELVESLDPLPPSDVRTAAANLSYRDFLTVALIVPESCGFPDNWIYIHDPEVSVGRIQNFRSWSPLMVKSGYTCLGMEYFVSIGDKLWEMADADLLELAAQELAKIGIARKDQIETGYVVRMPKAYPVYDDRYQEAVEAIRKWLDINVTNLYPVGRNGMHRYNNQDHSMYTAMLAVDNIVNAASHDIWSVNVDEEYHEVASTARR
jgi:protoporphyrinogen oxidase